MKDESDQMMVDEALEAETVEALRRLFGTCQEFRVLRSVKRSQLMAAVNRSPNRMAN